MGANPNYICIDKLVMAEHHWCIPELSVDLGTAISELRGLARGGLQEQREGEGEEVKGLKFISGKLARLFDRNRRLKYSHISRVLIDNFSSESNDSRNIKRRVYDAINVMVAAGLFHKSGDSLEKKEEDGFREKVEAMRQELDDQYTHRQAALATRKKLLAALHSRQRKLGELINRNKAIHACKEKITDPIFLSVGQGVESLRVGNGDTVWRVDLKRSAKRKGRPSKASTEVMKNHEYLDHL